MPNVAYFNSYKLKNGVSVSEFLTTTKKLVDEVISKHKGFISTTFLVDGEIWADYTIFETMEDFKAFKSASSAAHENGTNEIAEKFYSYIDCFSEYHFTVAQSSLADK